MIDVFETSAIQTKMFQAVADFVQENGACQEKITLPDEDYLVLEAEATAVSLGRQFWKAGPKWCNLDVLRGGNEIVVS